MTKTYIDLTKEQIETLISEGCNCEDWSKFKVTRDFDATKFRNVTFSGEIKIGALEGSFTLPGGIVRSSFISHATIHNCTIGDGCFIRNIQNYIANYDIEDGAYIENVGIIAIDGKTSFGNGVKVSVLNETGGRDVKIFDKLTSHQAYMSALYRYNPEFIEKLDALTDAYVEGTVSDRGVIGKGARVINSQSIINVKIGDYASIIGAARLFNGTINSIKEAPVSIGQGVICEDFIICSGSHVLDGTMMTRCFVGQACSFGHGYSASDSLFFCNCQGENGEACAIFAGPFTVTHHKSTLLIAGMFSFMNAGSGSNQSNHMYKLGPIHQGTLERGAKTASDSYILWPSRVGAFSLVMGRHVTHSDTTNLPFSYLIENHSTTYLVPGVNLRSVGTIRDAQKWPKRDGRKDPEKLDCVNFNLLSPFTIQKMMKGLSILENLKASSGELSDLYSFHSTKITNSSLKKGIKFYTIAIDKFIGNSLISRIQDPDGGFSISSEEELRSRLRPDSPIGSGEWVDVSGLIAPKSEIIALMKDVSNGDIKSLEEVNEAFATMHRNYYSYEWTWAFQHIQEIYGVNPSKMTFEDAKSIITRWKDAVVTLDKMVYDDANKEFNLASMTGYGADGGKEQKLQDFEQVRGDVENNEFVQSILKHIEIKSDLGDRALAALKECL